VALALTRGRPSTDSDAGIFLSVAARLLDGDRLYVDVWDNKDPLFFYTFAAALAGGDWRLPFVLDAVWLTVAGVGLYSLLRALGAGAPTASVGLVAYPVLLTGAYYYAGYSMLPALALAPVAGWAWARGRFALAGSLVGVACLYKLNLLLVAAAAPIAIALTSVPRRSALRATRRALLGASVPLLGAAAALAVSGELGAYLETVRDNVSYAGDVLVATGRPMGLYGHVWSAAGITDYTPLVAALGTAGVAVALWALARLRSRAPLAAVAALYLAAAATTGVTLAATAVWDHHAQVIAYPGALLAVLAASALERYITGRSRRLLATGLAVGVVVAAFGGFKPSPGVDGGESWTSSGRSETAAALEAARRASGASARPIRYAVLGTNHDEAHAEFIDGSWQLACPRFHQYPYSLHLDAVNACLQRERPTLVLVDSPLVPHDETASWNAFVRAARRLLRDAYVRVPADGADTAQVWRLRSISRERRRSPRRRARRRGRRPRRRPHGRPASARRPARRGARASARSRPPRPRSAQPG
jgi:hypothetical protein